MPTQILIIIIIKSNARYITNFTTKYLQTKVALRFKYCFGHQPLVFVLN